MKKTSNYSNASVYILAIFMLVGLIWFALPPTDNNNHDDLTVISDFWTTDEEGQSIAGVSQQAFQPTEPGKYLQSKAEQLESFIGINTAVGQLYWFDNGQVAHTYPILNITNKEPAASVPAGQNEISYRNERHLSRDGVAHLPYIQQFIGSHAIHGWPAYLDGQPVDTDFTGGSIWLSTADAEQVFQLASDGTPVVVTNKIDEETTPISKLPQVTAKSYVVADADTGHILARKSAHKPFPIASISKLMTAIVAEDQIDQNDSIFISQNAISTYGRSGSLTAGQSLRYSTLQYPLLLDSSNDAATAIAEHLEYDRFIDLMNHKASTIGMESTSFADPSGLSDGNISTARDLFQLSKYLHSQRPEILDITTKTFQTTPDPYSDGLRNFTNNHPLVGQDNFLGGKNGYTGNARYTLISIFKTKSQGVERNIAIIVLGSENYADDTRRLLQWAQRLE